MTEETAAKEAPEAQAVGAIEGPPDRPQANGERAESAVAGEPGEPSAQANGDIDALKGQLWALKNAVDAKAPSADLQELRSTLEELQRSLAEQQPAEGGVAVEPQQDGAQERVDALGRRLEELNRTVRATVLPERIDPTAIPPPVLQEVYERTLTDIYQEMARQFGTGAPRTTRAIMDDVRRASSGMEFFRLVDDRRIAATGLADALRRKLLSPHQVHLTYNEFFRRLSAEVPLFRAQSFADLVSARTSAYTVATVARLAERYEEVGRAQADISRRLDQAETKMQQVVAELNGRIDQLAAREEAHVTEVRDTAKKTAAGTSQAKRDRKRSA